MFRPNDPFGDDALRHHLTFTLTRAADKRLRLAVGTPHFELLRMLGRPAAPSWLVRSALFDMEALMGDTSCAELRLNASGGLPTVAMLASDV